VTNIFKAVAKYSGIAELGFDVAAGAADVGLQSQRVSFF